MTHAKTCTRRQVLRRGAAAVVGTLGAPSIARSLVAAGGRTSGANERIAIGLVACGRRCNNLRGILRGKTAEAQVVAAADCFLPRAEGVVKGTPGKAYQDYRRLLDSKDVDAVIVASPDHWHALHTIHACQAGKDVYVEKPMTLTILEGRRMVEAARKNKRIVQCGSQQRSMRANREGCEWVRNGRLGKVHTVIGFNYPSPWECKFSGQNVPAGLDWDMWCGPTDVVPFHPDIYAPRTKPGWISFRPWSGGEMTGWGAHGLDQVQWALGMDRGGPVEVWTLGEAFDPPTYTQPTGRGPGESACGKPKVLFRYPGGEVLKLENGPHGGAVFVGDKGQIRIDRGVRQPQPASIAAEPLGKDSVRLYVSDDHMQNWFDCIRSRKLPAADVEIGHRSSTVCHLGNIARWVGRKLRWDAVKEEFPGDTEANRYLDRQRRKPYEIPTSL